MTKKKPFCGFFELLYFKDALSTYYDLVGTHYLRSWGFQVSGYFILSAL